MSENEQNALPPHLAHFLNDVSSLSKDKQTESFRAYFALGKEEQALVSAAWKERDRREDEKRKDGIFQAFLGERSPEQASEEIQRDLRTFEEWLEQEAEADPAARKEKGMELSRSGKVYGNVGLGMWLNSVESSLLNRPNEWNERDGLEPCAILLKRGGKGEQDPKWAVPYEDVFLGYNEFLQRENEKWLKIFSEPLTRDAYLAQKSAWEEWCQMIPGESERYFNRMEEHGDIYVSVNYINPGGDMVYELWMQDKQDPSVSNFPMRFAWDSPGKEKGIRALAEAVAELAIEGAKSGKRGVEIMKDVRALLEQRSESQH